LALVEETGHQGIAKNQQGQALPGGAVSGSSKDDKILWRFMSDDNVPLTNNEAERALRGYMLWRKGSHGV
jgi:hypothetical protein